MISGLIQWLNHHQSKQNGVSQSAGLNDIVGNLAYYNERGRDGQQFCVALSLGCSGKAFEPRSTLMAQKLCAR